MGNLTRDPELRYTPKGTAIAKIGLAVNRVWTNEAGEKKEEVTFVDVDVFGRTAENVGQYMRKGRPILIEGRLQVGPMGRQANRPEEEPARGGGRKLCNFSAARGCRGGDGGAAPRPSARPARGCPAPPARGPNPRTPTARPKATTFPSESDFSRITHHEPSIFTYGKN